MSKARNLADIGSHDVIETDSDGVTITGGLSSNDLTVAGNAIATAGSLSNRNKIINGNFDIWQRGTSGSSGYVADRWKTVLTGTTAAISRQSFTLGQTDVPGEPTYFHRTVVTSVAGAGNLAILQQRIEDVRNFAGQTATLSFWAKADAAKDIAVEFIQHFGSGGSPSTVVVAIGVTTCALTTAWQKFVVTVNVPSISGKTLGTNGNNRLDFNFWLDAGSDWNARTNSLGQQSGTFDIAQVQLEAGDTATPFEHRSYGQELALCQRYYEKSYDLNTAPGSVTNIGMIAGRWSNTANDTVGGQVFFSVMKRATPTLVVYSPDSGNSGAIRSASSGSDISVTSIPHISVKGFPYANLALNGMIGGWYRFHYTASAEL